MTLQNAPPGLDYERDKRFSKVIDVLKLSYIHYKVLFLQSFVLFSLLRNW